MLPKELKEILHTEFVKYFERKSQKPRRKRQRKINFARIIFTKIHNYKIKRMIFKKDLEYNYYWQIMTTRPTGNVVNLRYIKNIK